MTAITYDLEPELGAAEFADVLVRSTLAERRPVGDLERLGRMLARADLIVTARTPERLLVGVARSISDFSYCTYLSDLAVDVAYQRRGIGRELIRLTREGSGSEASLVLLSAPQAETYYPHVGLKRHESCWTMPRSK